ncbi:hypothetical protein P23_0074 [Acinetobacter calcoaceticus]|nr:hypothetical protein P23_0074 [Acinetobacter calcoaceticus]
MMFLLFFSSLELKGFKLPYFLKYQEIQGLKFVWLIC